LNRQHFLIRGRRSEKNVSSLIYKPIRLNPLAVDLSWLESRIIQNSASTLTEFIELGANLSVIGET